MTNANQFNLVKQIQRSAKIAGFDIDASHSVLTLVPSKGLPAVLFTKTTGYTPPEHPSFDTIEEVREFLNGWVLFSTLLHRSTGIMEEEIRDRMTQHSVFNALKTDSKRKSRD